jgi:hypothetical protein
LGIVTLSRINRFALESFVDLASFGPLLRQLRAAIAQSTANTRGLWALWQRSKQTRANERNPGKGISLARNRWKRDAPSHTERIDA